MSHLQTRTLKPTLDIEPFIGLTTVQNTLVTADVLGHGIQGLDDAQPQLLALLVLGHGDVLNVADQTHIVDEFAFDDHGARAHDCARRVADHEDVVCVVAAGHEVVAGVEFGEGRFAYCGEDAEGVEKACKEQI